METDREIFDLLALLFVLVVFFLIPFYVVREYVDTHPVGRNTIVIYDYKHVPQPE